MAFPNISLKAVDVEKKLLTVMKKTKRKPSTDTVLTMLKAVYSCAAEHVVSSSASSELQYDKSRLPGELYVDGLQVEQIWQQLELLNRAKTLSKRLRKAGSKLRGYDFGSHTSDDFADANDESPSLNDEELPRTEDDNASSDDGSGYDNTLFGGAAERYTQKEPQFASGGRQKRRSIVDDKFFRLADMQTFLEQQEQPQQKQDSELNFDTFADDSGPDAGDEEYKYEDFFDPPSDHEGNEKTGKSTKTVSFAKDLSDDEESDGMHENAKVVYGDDADEGAVEGSAFEERQRRLRERMSSLEEQNLAGKGWQMSGEAAAVDRPENSALEEHLMFEHASKVAPTITEESTEKLEGLILRRIKDRAWDDVERKVKPKLDAAKYRNELVLDQEKSKKSLAEIYEDEYLKQTGQKQGDKTNPQHEEVRSMMSSLFAKLDALSNYHYSPKTPVPEVKLMNNMRSIDMEEVAPVVASSSTAVLAPEEVKEPSRGGELKEPEERTETDRLRERRKTKTIAKRRAQRHGHDGKSTLVTSNDKHSALKQLAPVAKTKIIGSQPKSSADFFKRLQKEASGIVKTAAVEESRKKQTNASKYKL